MSAAACAKYLRCWPDNHRVLDPRMQELAANVALGVVNNIFTDEQIQRLVDSGSGMTDVLEEEERIRRESRKRQKEYERTVWGAFMEDVLKEVEQS